MFRTGVLNVRWVNVRKKQPTANRTAAKSKREALTQYEVRTGNAPQENANHRSV